MLGQLSTKHFGRFGRFGHFFGRFRTALTIGGGKRFELHYYYTAVVLQLYCRIKYFRNWKRVKIIVKSYERKNVKTTCGFFLVTYSPH